MALKPTGVPTVNQLDSEATSQVVKAIGYSKLTRIIAGSSKWGVYEGSLSVLSGTYAENATEILLGTMIGDRSIGSLIGQFTNFKMPLKYDSIISVDVKRQANTSDFRIEEGGFNSYNKIQNPLMLTVEMSRCGTVHDRQQFLDSLEQAVGSTKLFDIMTPEAVYKQYTLDNYSVARKAENGGASMIIATCLFREIRRGKTVMSDATRKKKITEAASANDQPKETERAGTDKGKPKQKARKKYHDVNTRAQSVAVGDSAGYSATRKKNGEVEYSPPAPWHILSVL